MEPVDFAFNIGGFSPIPIHHAGPDSVRWRYLRREDQELPAGRPARLFALQAGHGEETLISLLAVVRFSGARAKPFRQYVTQPLGCTRPPGRMDAPEPW